MHTERHLNFVVRVCTNLHFAPKNGEAQHLTFTSNDAPSDSSLPPDLGLKALYLESGTLRCSQMIAAWALGQQAWSKAQGCRCLDGLAHLRWF